MVSKILIGSLMYIIGNVMGLIYGKACGIDKNTDDIKLYQSLANFASVLFLLAILVFILCIIYVCFISM